MKTEKSIRATSFYFWIGGMILMLFFEGCEKALQLKEPQLDPVSVFNEAWTVMDERYALFGVKATDWNEVYVRYKSMINETTDDNALFKIIGQMLSELKDGHISLVSSGSISTYDGFYKPFSPNFNASNIFSNYLQNDYYRIGPVVVKVSASTGYIYYESFRNEITDQQLDSIFTLVEDSKGLIVDIRNNSGGETENVNRLFARFISNEMLVKYEKWKNGKGHDDFYPVEPFLVAPASKAYTKKIAVLTNRACFSACNDFAYYMSALPQVILVGDKTGGGGGIPHSYRLANGWSLQYTAAMTLTVDGMTLENGISPDMAIDISSVDEQLGKDLILEKAYSLLQ